MLIFISGGVRSGKSSLGEKLTISLAGENRKIYLATARHYDEEITKRIQIHQQNRAGKDFLTIDKSWDIGEVAATLEAEDTIIVDCLGTLLANEMFGRPELSSESGESIESSTGTSFKEDNSEMSSPELIGAKILADFNLIHTKVANLIVVSNEVFTDGIQYAKSTEEYLENLAKLHIELAEASDVAIECLYSGYQCHKGKESLARIEQEIN